jgi:hypothetical protein
LVASSVKLVENRPRKMINAVDFGKPFAIHASREIDESVYDRIKEIVGVSDGPTEANRMFHGWGDPEQTEWQRWYRLSRITSAVIAVATIDSIVFDSTGLLANEIDRHLGEQRRWFFGPVGYVLRDVRALAKPVPCRGALGFWTLPPDVELAVAAQVRI